jgi:hypothetical protein
MTAVDLLRRSGGRRPIWQEPRKSLGHRLDQDGVLLASEVLAGEESEGRAECGAFGRVPELTVPCFPVHQRAGGFGQAEQRPAEILPTRTEIVLFDLGQSDALRGVGLGSA